MEPQLHATSSKDASAPHSTCRLPPNRRKAPEQNSGALGNDLDNHRAGSVPLHFFNLPILILDRRPFLHTCHLSRSFPQAVRQVWTAIFSEVSPRFSLLLHFPAFHRRPRVQRAWTCSVRVELINFPYRQSVEPSSPNPNTSSQRIRPSPYPQQTLDLHPHPT